MGGSRTLRQALESLISGHPYDPEQRTCRCVTDRAGDDDAIEPMTRSEHAAHVVNLVFRVLNGPSLTPASPSAVNHA